MKYLLLPLLLFVFVTSCDEDTKMPFDRKAMLDDLGAKVILPSFKAFSVKASNLSASLLELQKNLNQETLENCQSSWKEAALSWRSCELFNMEPFSDTYIKNRVSTWPAKVSRFDQIIHNAKEEIDRKLVDSGGSNTKGLSAIEYFLFDKVGIEKIFESKKHLAYLVALGEDLKIQAFEADRLWSVGNYSFYVFYKAKDGVELGGSISLTLNEMIGLIERIYISKLSKPLGVGKNGHLDVEGLEAWRSQYSLEFIKENINVLEQMYENGFYDYLDYLNLTPDSPLSNKIKKQFTIVKDELKGFSQTLAEIVAQNPKKLDPLLEEVRDLLVLIKVDSANQMGVTVTFNDNDGD